MILTPSVKNTHTFAIPQMTANFRAKSVTKRHQELWAVALTDTLEHSDSGFCQWAESHSSPGGRGLLFSYGLKRSGSHQLGSSIGLFNRSGVFKSSHDVFRLTG